MTNDPNEPVVLVKVSDEARAGIIVAALAEHGITAQATGGLTSAFRAGPPGDVRVLVRAADLLRARAALEAIRAESEDIDWLTLDVDESDQR